MDEQQSSSFIENIVWFIEGLFGWIHAKIDEFMHWAFPQFAQYHDQSQQTYHQHDLWYLLSLKWVIDGLVFLLHKMAVLFALLYDSVVVAAYYKLTDQASNQSWIGWLITAVIALVMLYVSYLIIGALIVLLVRRMKRFIANVKNKYHQYGTVLAVFKPKDAIEIINGQQVVYQARRQHNITVLQRLFNPAKSNVLVILIQFLFLSLLLSAMVILLHFTSYLGVIYWALLAGVIYSIMRLALVCNTSSFQASYNLATFTVFFFVFYTNFNIGVNGYLTDMILYHLGVAHPINFDPYVCVLVMYLSGISFVRYLLFYFYLEPLKAKKHPEAEYIDNQVSDSVDVSINTSSKPRFALRFCRRKKAVTA